MNNRKLRKQINKAATAKASYVAHWGQYTIHQLRRSMHFSRVSFNLFMMNHNGSIRKMSPKIKTANNLPNQG